MLSPESADVFEVANGSPIPTAEEVRTPATPVLDWYHPAVYLDMVAANIQLTKDLEETRALYDAILNNCAYRVAAKAWALRRAIGV